MAADLPAWFAHLEEEDHQFIKRLVLASGSLKELAGNYDVSYPTIRLRLNRLIERIKTLDVSLPADPFQAKVRLLVTDGELPPRMAKDLLRLHTVALKGARK